MWGVGQHGGWRYVGGRAVWGWESMGVERMWVGQHGGEAVWGWDSMGGAGSVLHGPS